MLLIIYFMQEFIHTCLSKQKSNQNFRFLVCQNMNENTNKVCIFSVVDVSLVAGVLPILETPSHSAWPWKVYLSEIRISRL